jgi:hypothetical protein
VVKPLSCAAQRGELGFVQLLHFASAQAGELIHGECTDLIRWQSAKLIAAQGCEL